MNLLGLDATCIGNHEFDYGWENILEQFNVLSFRFLMETSSLKGLINCYGITYGVIRKIILRSEYLGFMVSLLL